MGAPTVKICGLQSTQMLESMRRLSVDQIGFVFAESRRKVSPEQAAEMIDFIEKNFNGERRPLSVGVFVDPDLDELGKVLEVAPLDVVQLHGQESPQFCAEVKKNLKALVYKVFSISQSKPKLEQVRSEIMPYRGGIDAVMLDTFDPHVGGGTGKTFAWDCIPVYKQAAAELGIPLIVAGGLHPGNVDALILDYAPDGVDVSSGVETDGVKDISKIEQFIERAKLRHLKG
jgi:phosphoribosylanthranilate isomerase